jgi:hypothetical protein
MSMADQRNPFEPRLEGVPLVLTLDARSLSNLDGEARERAEFLCELCLTPAVEGLWTWGAAPLDSQLPQTELRPLDEVADARAVGLVGEPHGFIGVVRSWSSHERLAGDTYELTDSAADWFIYYSTAAQFHHNARRHFFVTEDPRVMSEFRDGPRQQYWQQRRIVTIGGALRLAGQVMLAREEVYDEATPSYRHHASSYTVYFYLAPELAPSRIRLHRWLEGQAVADREQEALEQSMHDRVVDLLKARDAVAIQNGRQQNNATLDEMLYHLRAAIGSAAALFDSIAVFAQLAVAIDEQRVGGATRVSLRNRAFRRELRTSGLTRLAASAGAASSVFELTWSLRNPIVHRAGMSGTTLIRLMGAPDREFHESRIHLSPAQVVALDSLRGQRHESEVEWGRDELASEVVVEPQAFSNRLCLAAIETAEQLTHALAEDLDAPDHLFQREPGEKQRIRRYRWLAGLPTAGLFATAK